MIYPNEIKTILKKAHEEGLIDLTLDFADDKLLAFNRIASREMGRGAWGLPRSAAERPRTYQEIKTILMKAYEAGLIGLSADFDAKLLPSKIPTKSKGPGRTHARQKPYQDINKMSLDFICHPRVTTNERVVLKCCPCESTIMNSRGIRFKQLSQCSKRKNIKRLSPQRAEERPKKLKDHPLGYTLSCNRYVCQLCDYTTSDTKHTNMIQQHCLQHFPGEYPCLDCGDVFHIKTCYTNHKNVECLTCHKKIKKGSMSSHSCKLKK